MEITFLGTASANPSPTRGVSCIIFRNDGTYWMFDCGEGSQIQLMKSQLKPGRISRIFITHLHGDHVFGLPGLLCTISQNFDPGKKVTVEIYGPRGLRKFLRICLTLSRSQLGFSYVVHELQPSAQQLACERLAATGDVFSELASEIERTEGEERLHPNEIAGRRIEADACGVWNVCASEQMVVKASWLSHRIPSFGFVIFENDSPGKLNVDLLKSNGVQPGPLYAQIKAGKDITSPSGQIIHAADVLEAPRPGRKVVILGDTCDSRCMESLVIGADVVVHEATLEDELEISALEKGHSTAGMAGRWARKVRAKLLVLTHFSQRYKPTSAEVREGEDSCVKLLRQAQNAFDGEVIAAEDLQTVVIPKRILNENKIC